MSNASTPLILAASALLLAIAAPAAATHILNHTTSDSDTCGVSTFCAVSATNNVSSNPPNDCTGGGTHTDPYTLCVIHQSCTMDVDGVATTGSLSCGSGTGACTTGSGDECSASAFDTKAIANGSCAWFSASATATNGLYSATASPSSIRVCVDDHGPYVN